MRGSALFGWPVLASLSAHVTGAAAAASMLTLTPPAPAPPPVPIDIVRVEPPAPPPEPPKPPPSRPKVLEKVTPPRLVTKPQAEIPPEALAPAPLLAESPRPESGPPVSGPVVPGQRFLASAGGSGVPVPGARTGTLAATGTLFSTGDLPIGTGRPGPGTRAEGPAAASKRDGSDLTAFARPLGGYQTKPRYPDSARRQGVEGVTMLRFEVLASGHVGTVTVASSAGHPDLDRAAVEAVKTWLFEPARRGKEPVNVWVTLPVRFTLQAE
jgi:protein TonB